MGVSAELGGSSWTPNPPFSIQPHDDRTLVTQPQVDGWVSGPTAPKGVPLGCRCSLVEGFFL